MKIYRSLQTYHETWPKWPNYKHMICIYSRVVGEKVMRCTVHIFYSCNWTLLPKRAKHIGVGWEETCQTQGSRQPSLPNEAPKRSGWSSPYPHSNNRKEVLLVIGYRDMGIWGYDCLVISNITILLRKILGFLQNIGSVVTS